MVLVVALAGFALLRWQAPMIAVATFGLPILVALYLREIDDGRAVGVRGVIAAVEHSYALVATAEGPYHQFSPDYGNGQPSGANLELALAMGKYVNSFRWNGDRYGSRP